MSERPIPADIWEAARAALLSHKPVEAIARALMQERARPRNARVAKQYDAVLDLWARGLTGQQIATALSFNTRGYVLRIVQLARQRGDIRAVARRQGPRPRQ